MKKIETYYDKRKILCFNEVIPGLSVIILCFSRADETDVSGIAEREDSGEATAAKLRLKQNWNQINYTLKLVTTHYNNVIF